MGGPTEPASCPPCDAARRDSHAETKGIAWLIGGFLICPCHLPVTLALISILLAGTTAAAFVQTHAIAVGTILTVLWIAATWRGVHYFRKVGRESRAALDLNGKDRAQRNSVHAS